METDYYRSSPIIKADKWVSSAIMHIFHSEFSDVLYRKWMLPGYIQVQSERRLNKVLNRPVHGGTPSMTFWGKLAGVKYLTLMDASTGYHNLN